jgi:hypothetical protein
VFYCVRGEEGRRREKEKKKGKKKKKKKKEKWENFLNLEIFGKRNKR